MTERQAKEGVTLQNIAMGGVKNLLDPTGQVREDVEITPSVIARLLEVGVKIERLARGEPTDNVAADHTGEVKDSNSLFPGRSRIAALGVEITRNYSAGQMKQRMFTKPRGASQQKG